MRNVTWEEWERTHHDYKAIINGQRYMLVLDPETQATILEPVTLILGGATNARRELPWHATT